MIAGNIQMIIVWYWDLRYIFYSSNIRISPNCRIFWSFSRNGVPTQDFRCLIKICELPVIDFINATSNSSKKRTNKRAMDNNSSISNNLAYFLNARFDHMFVCLSTDNNGCIEGACKSIFYKSYNLYNSVLAIDQVFGCDSQLASPIREWLQQKIRQDLQQYRLLYHGKYSTYHIHFARDHLYQFSVRKIYFGSLAWHNWAEKCRWWHHQNI